jgi:hypothetical protein
MLFFPDRAKQVAEGQKAKSPDHAGPGFFNTSLTCGCGQQFANVEASAHQDIS